MPTPAEMPSLDELVAGLRTLRERGLVRLRHTDLAPLGRAAERCGLLTEPGDVPGSIETLLRTAVARLDGGTLGAAATVTFGLGHGQRDLPAQERRRRAARAYGVSVERFRKHHERIVVEQVAEEIHKLGILGAPAARERAPRAELAPGIALTGRVGARPCRIVIHVEPVEVLYGVDVLVVPSNIYFELPQHFKSSVAAAVRKAAAVKGAGGEIISDVAADELRSWMRREGRTGLPVAPGTVAAVGPGQMAGQRIRRIYHAAIATPISGTNDYDVPATAIATAIRNVFALARGERDRYDPPLGSLAFPLLGAGRGALDPAVSFDWMWAAVERQIREYGSWEIHFITRRRPLADLIAAKLTAAGMITGEP